MSPSIELKSSVFKLKDEKEFIDLAIQVFNYQANYNPVYKQYVTSLGVTPKEVKQLKDIPFLPIEFFKNFRIIVEGAETQQIFKSSGTTDSGLSSHFVADVSLYEESFRKGFHHFFGNINQYCILALLPSYQENENSSLIYMVNDLIKQSSHVDSAFYLNNNEQLASKLMELEDKNQKTILIGVTYALLDFVETHKLKLKKTIVMETGGMKGRRKEMVREEVHKILCKGLGIKQVYSEYGMTELLSQAYSKGNGLFNLPPWMKIVIRDVEDPMHYLQNEKTGGINIIDLANMYSCSFISTQDLGKTHADGSFEILGRFDNSDLRGCNLLVE